MPCFRHTSPADNPAACSFSTLMICSSVNLLLRMSVSRRNGLYPNSGASKGSRSPAGRMSRRDQGRPGSTEGVEHDFAALRAVAQRVGDQRRWFDDWMHLQLYLAMRRHAADAG